MRQYSDYDSLLELCIQGDQNAWAVFVKQFSPLVRWAIRGKITQTTKPVNEHDIDDIHQQTFMRIWQNNRLKTLLHARSLTSWLVVTAQNTAVDYLRLRKVSDLRPQEELDEFPDSLSRNQRTDADANQLYERLDRLLSTLPLREQRIMTLELFYDFKHKQIAQVMDMPVNTVSTVISRIKHDLCKKLKEYGYDV